MTDITALEAQHQKLLMQSEVALSEARKLGEEIQRLKSKPKIDWSKMPVDTLVEVRYKEGDWIKRYFAEACHTGGYSCFDGGSTSKTAPGETVWFDIRLIENEPKPWFGGECPIPDGVKFKVWYRNGDCADASTKASKFYWWHHSFIYDIITYQILGEE